MKRAIARWFRRPSRVPRGPRIVLAVVLGALAVVGLAAPSSPGDTTSTNATSAPRDKNPEPPGAGNPTTTFPTSPALIAEGESLYQSDCSSCHGMALNGTPGVAPSLRGVGAGPVDFYLSTGRMPMANSREEPLRAPPAYTRNQMNALIAFVSRFGGPPTPAADPARGDLALGLQQFTLHCAGCHQVVARGGPTLGAVAPNLQQATAQQVAEAVRLGPYLMPHFDATQIDQHELDSIAAYVLWTRKPDNAGGWGIYNLGPIPEGIVAWFVALAALVIVARLIGERTA